MTISPEHARTRQLQIVSPAEKGRVQSTVARQSRLVHVLMAAVALGLLARVARFWFDLLIYRDEAYLLNNILVRTYRELLLPLDNAQAAPPAFCWIEKLCAQLGHADRMVRLLPFVAGLAAVGLFAMICRRTLRGAASWYALAILSVSHVVIISSVRAKPYSIDLLVGTLFTLLAVEWMRQPQRTSVLVTMAILTPLALWISYTAVFVIGGVGLVLCAYAFRQGGRADRPSTRGLLLVAATSAASFGLLYAVHLRSGLAGAETSGLREFWRDAFVPMSSLPRTVWWLLTTHTGRMYAYPVGEKNFLSLIPFALWVLGIVSLARLRSGWLLAILLAPQALLLGAAFAGKYPYGGHARICLFLAPAMCLPIGQGIASATACLSGPQRRKWRLVAGYGLAILPILEIAGAGLESWSEHRTGNVRDLVGSVAYKASPNDQIVCVNPCMVTSGGGGSRQVFEYYMQQLLGDRVHWAAKPTVRPAVGAQQFVIVYTDYETDFAVNALVTRLNSAADNGLAIRRSCVLRNPAGEVNMYIIPAADAGGRIERSRR